LIIEAWVVVLRTGNQQQMSEVGLVLSALEIEYKSVRVQGFWEISVPKVSASKAMAEIAQYAEESRAAPVGIRPLKELGSGRSGVLAYVVVLILVAWLSWSYSFGFDWMALGQTDATRMLMGEWWRTFTSLTLHVDLSHLVGNIVFGGFFGLYVGLYLGSGLGWFSILVGGVLGNAMNVLIRPEPHYAVGASTAVFAALGILAAYIWRQGFWEATHWKTRIAPVTAGICLLAFTGMGSGASNDNVDIFAHVTGFIGGFLMGLLVSRFSIPTNLGIQRFWGMFALVSLAFAWSIALINPTLG
tara:strand:+ start:858 stop:1760 length:903 start_codon:yes stop_codon:yes gene_type:complete